ncbi:unnamed protein product [Rotaria sp. Silwood2]|nr:unnamed protein product [Rotaria sp. Silwood2]CAF3178919.1 unnamed protein product [Rotaria sp. Silwood2]CAF3197413.1 unnamed protein product [Rotaria sp. Silwood2]CAF4186620.1 unnamed protein product [Rotaria sp. Silwood2]CAF4483803.1 unnamed protein product [Rotaria sp. Silwood2]
MDEENEKWSIKHLKNLSVTSTETSNTLQINSTEVSETVANSAIERMELCINKIKDNQINEEQKKEFLAEFCHCGEELHSTEGFSPFDGLDIHSTLLDEDNDHCQRITVQSGLEKKLLKIFDESNDSDLKTKAVTAISGMN